MTDNNQYVTCPWDPELNVDIKNSMDLIEHFGQITKSKIVSSHAFSPDNPYFFLVYAYPNSVTHVKCSPTPDTRISLFGKYKSGPLRFDQAQQTSESNAQSILTTGSTAVIVDTTCTLTFSTQSDSGWLFFGLTASSQISSVSLSYTISVDNINSFETGINSLTYLNNGLPTPPKYLEVKDQTGNSTVYQFLKD